MSPGGPPRRQQVTSNAMLAENMRKAMDSRSVIEQTQLEAG